MAQLPACHLVAFPEPVATALFRPSLNVPPAPRGPRSWSAVTRRPCGSGHPRGARLGPPRVPTPPGLQAGPAASPAVPDPAQLPASRRSVLREPPEYGPGLERVGDSPSPRSSSPRATSAPSRDLKPESFASWGPAAVKKSVPKAVDDRISEVHGGLFPLRRSPAKSHVRRAGSTGGGAGTHPASGGAAAHAAGPAAARRWESAPEARRSAGCCSERPASLGATCYGAGVLPARARGGQRARPLQTASPRTSVQKGFRFNGASGRPF